jgi:hypothetical protein
MIMERLDYRIPGREGEGPAGSRPYEHVPRLVGRYGESGLGNYATGNAGRGAATGGAGYGVNDDGGSAVAEDGMIIRAEGNVGSDGADVGSAVG